MLCSNRTMPLVPFQLIPPNPARRDLTFRPRKCGHHDWEDKVGTTLVLLAILQIAAGAVPTFSAYPQCAMDRATRECSIGESIGPISWNGTGRGFAQSRITKSRTAAPSTPPGANVVRNCFDPKFGTGADAGARIARCINDLPPSGGVADARGFEGTWAVSTNPFPPKRGVLLLLGATTFKTSVTWTVGANDLRIFGAYHDMTRIDATSAIRMFDGGSYDGIMIENVEFDGGGVSTSGLRLGTTTVNEILLKNVRIFSAGATALDIGYTIDSTFERVDIEAIKSGSVQIGVSVIGNGNMWRDLRVGGATIAGMDLAGANAETCEGCIFSGNKTDIRISQYTGRNTFTSCWFENSKGGIVTVNGTAGIGDLTFYSPLLHTFGTKLMDLTGATSGTLSIYSPDVFTTTTSTQIILPAGLTALVMFQDGGDPITFRGDGTSTIVSSAGAISTGDFVLSPKGWSTFPANVGPASAAPSLAKGLGIASNYTNEGGEVDFFANRGRGTVGGYSFYDWDGASATLIGRLNGSGTLSAKSFATIETCNSSGSPADCGAAPVGTVVIPAGSTEVQVDTTVVTGQSQIFVTEDLTASGKLGISCNGAVGRVYAISARTPGSRFTIMASAAPVGSAACLNYQIIN